MGRFSAKSRSNWTGVKAKYGIIEWYGVAVGCFGRYVAAAARPGVLAALVHVIPALDEASRLVGGWNGYGWLPVGGREAFGKGSLTIYVVKPSNVRRLKPSAAASGGGVGGRQASPAGQRAEPPKRAPGM